VLKQISVKNFELKQFRAKKTQTKKIVKKIYFFRFISCPNVIITFEQRINLFSSINFSFFISDLFSNFPDWGISIQKTIGKCQFMW